MARLVRDDPATTMGLDRDGLAESLIHGYMFLGDQAKRVGLGFGQAPLMCRMIA